MAVNAMAISIGKNNANTGTNIVPKPKPENRVSPEPINAAKQMMMYSIIPLPASPKGEGVLL